MKRHSFCRVTLGIMAGCVVNCRPLAKPLQLKTGNGTPPKPYIAWEPSEHADTAGYYFNEELLGAGTIGFRRMIEKLSQLKDGAIVHVFVPYNSRILGEDPAAQIPFCRIPALDKEFNKLVSDRNFGLELFEAGDPKYDGVVPGTRINKQ